MSEKLSDKTLREHLDYVQSECQKCAEHHDYECFQCPHFKRCKQAYQQINQRLSQPKVTREWIYKWESEFMDIYHLGRPNYHRELRKLLPKMLKELGREVEE